ncbi:DUF3545 domain-containing protein [Alteromonadales bacterium alter-6D02]|nr:DUF3545 domain-containing protein [Alteromonadales bacterium alter-6D02]
MKALDFYDNYQHQMELEEQPQRVKRKAKQSKRKWREIEMVKEKQRLRREFVDYNEYTVENDLASIFL